MFGTYKLNVLTSLWLLPLLYTIFTWAHITIFYLTFWIIGSYSVFISRLGLLIRSQKPNIYVDSLRRLIFHCSSLLIFLTSSHHGRCFRFSFDIWPAIPEFSISPRTTAFRYSCNLTFGGWHVSLFHTLPQLHGREYTVLGHVKFC